MRLCPKSVKKGCYSGLYITVCKDTPHKMLSQSAGFMGREELFISTSLSLPCTGRKSLFWGLILSHGKKVLRTRAEPTNLPGGYTAQYQLTADMLVPIIKKKQ